MVAWVLGVKPCIGDGLDARRPGLRIDRLFNAGPARKDALDVAVHGGHSLAKANGGNGGGGVGADAGECEPSGMRVGKRACFVNGLGRLVKQPGASVIP